MGTSTAQRWSRASHGCPRPCGGALKPRQAALLVLLVTGAFHVLPVRRAG